MPTAWPQSKDCAKAFHKQNLEVQEVWYDEAGQDGLDLRDPAPGSHIHRLPRRCLGIRIPTTTDSRQTGLSRHRHSPGQQAKEQRKANIDNIPAGIRLRPRPPILTPPQLPITAPPPIQPPPPPILPARVS